MPMGRKSTHCCAPQKGNIPELISYLESSFTWEKAEIVAKTHEQTVDQSAEQILSYLQQRGIVSS